MFFGVSAHLGGAERSLLDFLKIYQSDPQRSDFFVLLAKAEGPLIDELKNLGIPYKTLPFPSWALKLSRHSKTYFLRPLLSPLSMIRYLYNLRNLILTENVDTLHCTGIKCHLFGLLVSLLVKVRVIIHLRDIVARPAVVRFFNFFAKNKSIVWLSCSKATAQAFPSIPTILIYDGMDDNVFFPARNNQIKEQLKIPLHATLFGLVGIVAKWKGHREFLLAAHEVLKEEPNTYFVVVGDQIYDTSGDPFFLQELKNTCTQLGLDKYFYFLGFQKEVAPLYNSLDWLVHASITPEPFGRVLPEAMLCKTAIIASRAGGVLEIIDEGKTGLLHTPGDVADLARTMKKALLMKPAEKEKLIESAYDFCKRTYILRDRYMGLKEIIENNNSSSVFC
jgi:glycosyltransferase involved in cell wall biosynthesis